ncbi:MAG TPA: hypothetical protein VGM87_05595 [Roseomonas sp.]|jgi:hypothetical protein
MSEAALIAKLERAIAHGGNLATLPDVAQRIRDGRAQFWQEGETVAVTEMLQYPRGSAVRYWLTAGNIRQACALLPKIESWAREQGAVRAEALGRTGWTRLARQHGYEPRSILFVKDLMA